MPSSAQSFTKVSRRVPVSNPRQLVNTLSVLLHYNLLVPKTSQDSAVPRLRGTRACSRSAVLMQERIPLSPPPPGMRAGYRRRHGSSRETCASLGATMFVERYSLSSKRLN